MKVDICMKNTDCLQQMALWALGEIFGYDGQLGDSDYDEISEKLDADSITTKDLIRECFTSQRLYEVAEFDSAINPYVKQVMSYVYYEFDSLSLKEKRKCNILELIKSNL